MNKVINKTWINPRDNPLKINIFTERYCYKCHNIRHKLEFLQKLYSFKQSGLCNICRNNK